MLHFPMLRTRRLTVQLRELSIDESIALAAMPSHLEEAACTAFLRHAVASAQGAAHGSGPGVENPAHWTVQERTLAVCHYLAATAEDGPDFAVGNAGHYSDYLDGAADIRIDHGASGAQAELAEAGEVGGDVWHIRHLTGAMAESIERMAGEVGDARGNPLPGRLHWILGAMAAQMVRTAESVPDADAPEGAFDEFLVARMKVMKAFPESDFLALMGLYFAARDQLHHLFRLEFTSGGIVVMPKGGAAANLPPAMFPAHSCLTGMAAELVGKPDEPGR